MIRNDKIIYFCTIAITVGTPNLNEFDASGIERAIDIFDTFTLTYLLRAIIFIFVGTIVGLLISYRAAIRHPVRTQLSELRICWIMHLWLAFSSILSFTNYFDLAISSYRILEWLIALITIHLFIKTHNRHASEKLYIFLRTASIISLLILALIWIYNPSLTYSTSIAGYSRLGGVAMHPNGLGLLLGFGALCWCITGRHNKFWILISSGLMLACLLTKSRSGIGAASITALVYFALRSLAAKKVSNFTIAIALFMFGGLTLLTFVYIDTILPYFLRGEDVGYLLRAAGRFDVWLGALDIFKESPIFGHGFIFGPKLLIYSSYIPMHWRAGHAHNEFLNMAIAGGIVGLIILISIYIKTFVNSLRMLRTDPLLIAMFIGIFVANLFETGLSTSFGIRGFLLIALFHVVTIESKTLKNSKYENPPSTQSLPTTRR